MGMPYKKELYRYQYNLAAPESEFYPSFIQAMANRMAFSFHKYGAVADFDGDTVASAQLRIGMYSKTGNTEWLVDAANFLMMEFMRHPEAFQSTDSDQSPGRIRADGSIDTNPNL